MRALLLAAGLGTRLRPITNTVPKCLVPVNEKPLLDYWLQYLSEAGIGPLLINTHYLPETIEKHLDSSPFKSNLSLVYEKVLLGTGGTVLKNKAFYCDEPIMVIHADNLCKCDLNEFISAHRQRPIATIMTMMLFRSPNPSSCGIVELDSEGIVKEFHEKKQNPPGNLANAAVYILEPEIITLLETFNKEVIDISTELLPMLMGKINTWVNRGYHRDIGNPESLKLAESEFKNFLKNHD